MLVFSYEHASIRLIWISFPLRLLFRRLLQSNYCACKNNDEWNEFKALIVICFSKNTAWHHGLGIDSIALGTNARAGLCWSCVNALNYLRINGPTQVFQCRAESMPEDMTGICSELGGSDWGFRDDPNTPCVQFLWLISLVEASALVPCSTWDSPPRVRRWWVLPEASDLLIHQYNLCVRPS